MRKKFSIEIDVIKDQCKFITKVKWFMLPLMFIPWVLVTMFMILSDGLSIGIQILLELSTKKEEDV